MNQYGPLSNGAAFPRGPPPFRGPPPAFPRTGPPPLHPPFPPRGSASSVYSFRAPPSSFTGRGMPSIGGPPPSVARPPMGLTLPSPAPSTLNTMLPSGWSEHKTPQGSSYYYNAVTGISTYEFPITSSSLSPDTPTWIEYKDDATGALYYFNTRTKETVWDQPEEFRMQKAREQVAKMTSETLQTASPGPAGAEQQEPVNEKGTDLMDTDENVEETRQASHEKARKKRKDEQERDQAKAFEKMTPSDRLTAFKQFLEENQIASTLKWGDAQRLINKDTSMQADPRWKFALTTVGEKKQAFAEYCTHAKNRATIEKRRVVKKRREEFMELLRLFESSLVTSSRRHPMKWEDVNTSNELYAMRQDPRWTAIAEERERQQLFTTFLQELERNQKARMAKQRDAIHRAFLEVLEQRLKSKELELGTQSSKRLDSDTKRRVLQVFEDVKVLETNGKKLGDEALRLIDRHDVYEWAERFLDEYREREHAKRKRERVEREKRHENLSRELTDRLKELAKAQRLTAGSTWDEFSTTYLIHASEKSQEQEEDDEREEGEGDGEHLHLKTQRRIFEKYVRRLRRNLEFAASVIRKHLDRSGDAAFRVTEGTSYDAFVEALETGVGIALETKAPEEGEEETSDKTEKKKKKKKKEEEEEEEKEEDEDVKQMKADEIDALLEATVKEQRELQTTTTVTFPPFVRQVYDMWIAMAKENKRDEGKKAKHRKRSRKESRESDLDDERPRRSRRHSSITEEGGDDESHKKRRSHRVSKKRRRTSSLSCSRSRSRSLLRRESSSHRRSRRSRHRSRSRDREGTLPASLAPSSSKAELETMETTFSPLRRSPSKALSAAEEAAKAEEIIRQARLKMVTKRKSNSHDSELEEGEEVEEGEG